jgi:hypothetical protein
MRVIIGKDKIVGCDKCGDSWAKRPTPKDPKGNKLPKHCRSCRKTGGLYWVKEK